MRIAVTGSEGFVGSHLVKRLKELDADIIGLDIKSGIDITDWKQVRSTERFDVLFHLAAKSYVPDSYKYPRDFYYSNMVGTINALELCRLQQSKIVFISSYVYGVPRYLPIDEKHPVTAFNPYAQTKIIGEQLCSGYSRDFGIPAIILRPFNIYGEGQDENFLIPTMVKQAKTGRISLKDPYPKRDYIYIDDVVDFFVKVMEYRPTECEIFNVGTGISYSVREIAEMISELFGNEIELEFNGKRRKNEVMDTKADITKAEKVLGWSPKTDVRQGLQRLVDDANKDVNETEKREDSNP